jgi:hypothetical protein
VALGLGGCPDLPRSEGESFDATFFPEPDVLLDGEGLDVLIPLGVMRVRASLGEPEGGERVTILGAGMNPGARVFFGDVPASGILVLDEVSLNCDVPAHEPGLVDVRIELLDGQSVTLENGYLYRGPLRYGGITPELGPLAGGVPVTITGEGFDEETRVLIGGRLLEGLELVDETTLTGALPGQMHGHRGWADVIVTNGFEQRTGEWVFRYVTPLRVDRLDPPGGARAGGTTLILTGEGLEAGTEVRLGGVLAETLEAGNGTQIVVRTPPLPHGAQALSLTNAIDELNIDAAWMSVDPDHVPAGVYIAHAWPPVASVVGGEVLDLIVSGLASNATPLNIKVLVDGSEASVLSVDAESDWVRIVLPPGASGLADVMVQTPTESAARIGLFQRAPLLAIASVWPADGLAQGGASLVVLGAGFQEGVQVFFGATEASEVVIESDQMLRVTTPSAQPGRVDLSVALDGRSARAPTGFSYYMDGPPRLLAVSPEYGSRAGSRVVRLHGTGLRGGTGEESVLFGIQTVPNLGPLDDTTVVVRTRSDDEGHVNVDAGELGLLAMPYEAYDPTQRYGGVAGGPSREAVNVTVLELVTRDPVDGAMVIWWDDLGTPHQGLTDLRGQITLSDVDFEGPHMISAGKNMYTTSSVVDFESRNVTLLLLSLSPPMDGNGGGGEVTEPIPKSPLSGEVTGYDKYVLPPPGDCDSKIAAGVIDPESTLCDPCDGDEECGAGAVCTPLGDQGSRCTVACEGADDCPDGFSCVGTGFGAIQCIPSPGQRTAWCGTTQSDVFSYGGSDPFLTGFTNGVDTFAVEASPGEHAIVCIGGYRDPDTNEFIPMMMGVRRHVFALPGESLVGQDVELDIPLERTLRIRLDGAPIGVGTARNHAVDVFIDLGADGVFRMPARGVAVDENAFELEGFPTVFEDSLTGASYTFLAAAVPDATLAGESNDAAMTFLEDVVSLNEDSIVHVTDAGVLADSTGMVEDVADLQGPGDGTLWAASIDGRVLRYDGIWWGLHQTPTHADLKAVFESPLGEVYAAGDDGVFFRFDGLVWQSIPMPDSLLGTDWWALTGTLSTVFLAGSRGVYAYDGETWTPLNPGPDAPQGTIRDLWSDGFDTLWMVGDGGRIRRWVDAQTTVFDQPGSDLLAVHGSHGGDVWAVGRKGRIAHYDGDVFFDFLPRVRHDLYGVHGADPAHAWAVGDAGASLGWDGERWQVLGEGVNVDLRAVRSTGSGPVIAGGLHTVILGPFLDIPRSVNPTSLGDVLSLDLRWSAGDPELADFTYLQLMEGSGFPFWTLSLRGERLETPLPDFMALAGIFSIWPGPGWIRAWRIHAPGLSIDDHDGRDLSQTVWRSWSISDFPAIWP